MRPIRISVVKGDITEIDADAIVNPANSLGIMGGGVALAIRRAGGKSIESEAMANAPIQIGRAVATTAGRLKARYVIHAPTMEKPAMRTDEQRVRKAVHAALRVADGLELRKIAMPGMGTGIGGLGPIKAARVMVDEIKSYESRNRFIEEVVLVAYTDDLKNAFEKVLTELK
ncbi:macro domain-containing protein [Candidatus Micrarchaeota archaeon]|nr:macro domain-containing protein [Candidatus Micrarchaeota archaeon]